MALMLTDAGAQALLTRAFAAGQNLTLRLFTNNVTLTDQLTSASFTEAAGGGYAAKTLTGGSWTIGNDAGGIPQAAYAQQSFVFTGALTGNATIYGYAVFSGTTVLWAEKLDVPRQPAVNNDTLRITPTFKLGNGTPA